jgi:hypothetical protein
MWFKVFVLLRLPIGIICLLGYPAMLGAWGGPQIAFLGGVFVVGLYVFLAFTSIRLIWLLRGALTLAVWLLALETVGAVMLVMGGDYMATQRFDPHLAPGVATIVTVGWTLPNALLFYKARKLF